ncbi:MAG TPA: RCC1 domain-containing protein [Polyangiaceae bacterium]|nr:RCC1 domain-containing protein [Polyangiaceae bacterium]
MPSPLEFVEQFKVRELALDAANVCHIDEQGSTLCDWSSFGPGDLTVPDGEQFAHVSVGYGFACGLRTADGSLVCWGSAGTEACNWSPVAGQLEAPAGAFKQLVSRNLTSCAVDDAGSLKCWGAGEAADDPQALCREGTFNYGQADPPEGVYAKVELGAFHGCAIRDDGTVACWGAGETDDCLDVGADCRQSRPLPGVFVQLALGNWHTCAMTAERKVQCWGYDANGDGRTMPPAVFQ